MPVTLEELVANLAERPLPALAITTHQVNQLLDDPNTSNLDMQEIISLDPGLTMEIYRLYASTAGERRGPASNIAHAISMLGPVPLKTAINNIPVLNTARPAAADDGQFICYSHAIHAAIYAKKMGEMHQDKNPDEMGHAALLFNCGEMALWKYATKAMKKIYALVEKGADYGSASQSILGFTTDQLSLELAKSWGLSPLLVECLETKWHQLSRPNAVVLANSYAMVSAQGWHNDESLQVMEFIADLYHQPMSKISAKFHTMTAEIARRADGFPLPLTAYNTLLEKPKTIREEPKEELKQRPEKPVAEKPIIEHKPVKEKPVFNIPAAKPKIEIKRPQEIKKPEQATKVSARATISEAIQAAKKKEKLKQSQEIKIPEPAAKAPVKKSIELFSPPPAKEKKRDTTPQPVMQETVAKEEKQKTIEKEIPEVPEHKPTKASVPMIWKESLASALREIRRELGLRRVMFARISSDRKSVSVAHVLGADIYSKLNKFSLSLERKNLFGLLLSKQQGFWFKADNREKYLPLIPEEVLDALDQRGFFCMSVFIEGNPAGFVYADGREAMNDENYVKFKQMCSDLGDTLKQK